jgi:glycosyltransferase involved in cell wall biosynthesis
MESKDKFSVCLFIPFKNELEGLKVIMPQISSEWYDELFLLDGSSTDGSREWLESKGFKVTAQKSRNVRAAFWEAFEQINSEVIIPFSPDGNSVPTDIPLLIEEMRTRKLDLVIASRYRNGLRSLDDDWKSRIGNLFFTKLINFLFKTTFTDVLVMFRAFYKSHLYELGLDNYREDYIEVMMLTRGVKRGLRVGEIPSLEPARFGSPESRAHPGVFGKHRAAIVMLKSILRDFLFYSRSNF